MDYFRINDVTDLNEETFSYSRLVQTIALIGGRFIPKQIFQINEHEYNPLFSGLNQ